MQFSYVTLFSRVRQVPEQQQDQRFGAGSPGPPGLDSPDPETEPKPHQPDPRQSLSAPEAHPAVSTAGFLQLGDAVGRGRGWGWGKQGHGLVLSK